MAILRLEVTNPKFGRENTKNITVHSSYLHNRQNISIYNPYSKAIDLPVIILLHGVYGNHWSWMDLGGVHLVYENLRKQGLNEFVLVMPSDGGLWDGSAYLPLMEHGDYEQWIVDDVLTAVKKTVSSVTDSSRWYISGLSMGGYGALRLGTKFANKFAGISAHSAITQIEDMSQFVDTPLNNYKCQHQHETEISYWSEVNKAQLPPLRFDCGQQDTLLQSNNRLAEKLKKLAIVFNYKTMPGGHEWPYWHTNISTTFKFFSSIEKNSLK